MTKWHGGKGSIPRPIADKSKFEENWERIFGKQEKSENEKPKAPDTNPKS